MNEQSRPFQAQQSIKFDCKADRDDRNGSWRAYWDGGVVFLAAGYFLNIFSLFPSQTPEILPLNQVSMVIWIQKETVKVSQSTKNLSLFGNTNRIRLSQILQEDCSFPSLIEIAAPPVVHSPNSEVVNFSTFLENE
jgi:hypothetical protein